MHHWFLVSITPLSKISPELCHGLTSQPKSVESGISWLWYCVAHGAAHW